jgi:hypothetical protein
VAPIHYPPSPEERIDAVTHLAGRESNAADAALVALLRRSQTHDAAADAAVEALARRRPDAVVKHLPGLIEFALMVSSETFPVYGRRLLVRLAGEMRLEEAAPVLRRFLAEDRDLACPADAALALGAIGRKEDLPALLAVARDRSRDVYFRRRATDAVGRIDLAALSAGDDPLDRDPALALSCAAARFARTGDAASRGALLSALEDPHTADDAAAWCAKLGILEAIPLLRDVLVERKDYAAPELRSALEALQARAAAR